MNQLGTTAYLPTHFADGKKQPRPWRSTDTCPIARLRLFKYDVDLMVLAGTSDDTLAVGPGHLAASALPGNRGNSVIVADHDSYFDFLTELAIGDRILVQRSDGREFWFRVKDVEAGCNYAPEPETEYSILSLISRDPANSFHSYGPLRYVVTAQGIPATRRAVAANRDNNLLHRDRKIAPSASVSEFNQ